MPSPDLQRLLRDTFGFPGFRASQQAVCEAAVAGRDVLLVMPTGAGKSLCYQLPALARGGTALVISPLIALMDDQAQKLEKLGFRVGRIHSGFSREHSREVCRNYLDGKLQFLFIAPERFRVPGFGAMLAKGSLSLVAVDEAHCISQWGHDFRPDYRNLAAHLQQLRPAPVVALTATATPQVQRDIVSELGLRDPAQFIQGFRRTNLAVEVVEISKPRRTDLARKLLRDPESRPAIIYAPSRKEAESLASDLSRDFRTATYHAGLDPGTRERVQRAFLEGEVEAVVATVAFGMGIDKADVRTVLHTAMPASVESYYQEIGRAGRDGDPARTVLMYSFADRRMHDFFLERDYPPADTLARISAALHAEPVHADDLRILLKLDMDVFGPALDKLLAQGAAQIDMAGNVTRTAATAAAWRRSYEAQVSHRRGQIDAMMRFAEGTGCRMTALIRHFGDSSDSHRSCGMCDFCAPHGSSAQAFREPTREELREMQRVIRGLGGKGNGTSTGKLHTELYPRKELERKELDALLEALVRAGYLTMESDTFTKDDGTDITYRKVMLTHEGREAESGEPLVNVQMRDIEAANAGRVRKGDSQPTRNARREKRDAEESVPLTSAQKAIDAALRTWRAGEAKSMGKPAFVVFSDRTLRHLVVELPSSLVELREISGIGPAKAERWGEAILEVLGEKHLPDHPTTATATSHKAVRPRDNKQPEPQQRAPMAGTGTSLEHSLQVWRMHEAKRLERAPFALLTNSTLAAIADAKPQTTRDLERVAGVDRRWVAQHGDTVCAIIAQHLQTAIHLVV